MVRVSFGLVLLMTSLGLAPRASAAVVARDTGKPCGFEVDVVEWTPAKGAVARFVAETFARSTREGIWIGLGRTKTAYWSAEGGVDDDLCWETCRSLDLVETRLDGTRVRHPLVRQASHPFTANDVKATETRALSALFALAKTKWPAASLQAGAPIATSATKTSPFVVEVALESARLRWDLRATQSGCSCAFAWTAKKT